MYDDDEEDYKPDYPKHQNHGAPYLNMPTRSDETHSGRIGHYTGRCGHCGSSNLWDDNSAYGCNSCGRMWVGG